MRLLHKTFLALSPVFFVFFMMIITADQSHAADPLFTVDNVLVDVTASSAVEAREQAFAEAQQKAFDVLAKRMLSASELASFSVPETDIVSTLIQDFEISNEQLSSVRYKASYKFRFKDNDVRQFLNTRGVSYSDISAETALILPYFQHQGEVDLWSPSNIWMQAWARSEDANNASNLVVPLGDISDVRDISGDDPLQYEDRRLSRALSRYDATEAIILIAIPDQRLSQVTSLDTPASGMLNINIYRTDRGYPEYIRALDIRARNQETLFSLMGRGVNQVKSFLSEDWKSRTSSRGSGGGSADIYIPVRSLSQWADIQSALRRVNSVEEVNIQSLSPNQAHVKLKYRGDIQRLELALKQAGMRITPRNKLINQNQVFSYFTDGKNSQAMTYDLTFERSQYSRIQPQAGDEAIRNEPEINVTDQNKYMNEF